MTFQSPAILFCSWALCFQPASGGEGVENFAFQKELPSGPGIAAEFKADVGLQKKEGVIFADGFESGDFAAWDEKDEEKKNVFTFPSPESPELGNHCLRAEAHLGKDTGGGVTKWFSSAGTLFIRFYTEFAPDCDYVHHFVTLRANKSLQGAEKWNGFGGAGLKPVGDERFSTAIEPWGDWGRNTAPGRWNFYSYWNEMETSLDGKFQGHSWGKSFAVKDSPLITKSKWICVEFMLVHNTPGKRDGEQAYWIDGTLMGRWKGINWRKQEKLMANALTVESYITDLWTKNQVNVVYFDNVVVATRYIGPSGK